MSGMGGAIGIAIAFFVSAIATTHVTLLTLDADTLPT